MPTRRCQPRESSFQHKIYGLARLNSWQITVEDLRESNPTPLFPHLMHYFRNKLKKPLAFLIGRKRRDFLLCYHTKDSRHSAPGYPDLTLVHPHTGKIIFAELKRDNEYPTLEQRLWLSALTRAAEVNPLVECHLWKPKDWPIIVEALGGKDSRYNA